MSTTYNVPVNIRVDEKESQLLNDALSRKSMMLLSLAPVAMQQSGLLC